MADDDPYAGMLGATPDAATPASGANPYEGMLSGAAPSGPAPSPRQPYNLPNAILSNVGAGLNEGLADTVGAPVDAATWLLNRIPGVNIQKPFLGSESIKSGLGLVGANPNTVPAPGNLIEKLARGAGTGMGAMAGPGAVVGALRTAGMRIPGAVADIAGTPKSGADIGKLAVTGAGAGATGAAAVNFAPEPLKGIAGVLGGLIGGGVGALAGTGLVEGVPAGVRAAKSGMDSLSKSPINKGKSVAADKAAVQTVRNAGGSDLQNQLDDSPGPLVPGSQPTLGQQTGNMGVLSLERDVANRDPVPFLNRRADQNNARVANINAMQPGGHPEDVSALLRQQLADIDAQHSAVVDSATDAARQANQGLGAPSTPDALGGDTRQALVEAEAAAKERERGLWRAVDPDGTLTLPVTPLHQAVSDIYGNLTDAATSSLTPAEKQLLTVIDGYKPMEPFREVADLRSIVSGTMRQELAANGRTPAYARLTQLRGGVEDAISKAVDFQAQEDAKDVAAGTLAPDQAMAARMEAQRAAWYDARKAATGTGGGTSVGANGSAGPTALSSVSGTKGSTNRGLGSSASDQGLPSDVPGAPFDAAAKDRLDAATAATKQRAQTFGARPNDSVLRSAGTANSYRLPDAAVPDKVFHPGATGASDVNAYRQAAGDQAALPILRDIAVASMRKAAENQDGTIDPANLARWQLNHAGALRGFPDLQAQFRDAGTASEAVADAAAARQAALDAHQEGALGKVMQADNPVDAISRVGGIFGTRTGYNDMRSLVARIGSDDTARQGLRKAIVDYVTGKFVGNTEAAATGERQLKGDQFQTFINRNAETLGLVFSPEEVGRWRAIAADAQRSNRSQAAKIPGQSDTAQNMPSVLANTLSKIALPGQVGATMTAGAMLHGSPGILTGAAAGFGAALSAKLIASMRVAGIRNVEDLTKRMLLDPEFARLMLSKYPARPDSGPVLSIGQHLRLGTILGPAIGLGTSQQ